MLAPYEISKPFLVFIYICVWIQLLHYYLYRINTYNYCVYAIRIHLKLSDDCLEHYTEYQQHSISVDKLGKYNEVIIDFNTYQKLLNIKWDAKLKLLMLKEN